MADLPHRTKPYTLTNPAYLHQLRWLSREMGRDVECVIRDCLHIMLIARATLTGVPFDFTEHIATTYKE